MGNRIHSLTLTTKGAASKVALGATSLMVLTVIGSATLAGATPVTGTTNAQNPTSLAKHNEKDNNKDKEKDHQNNRDKEHHKNNGHHGYGGGNDNAIETNINAKQSGDNNIFSVIINYIFG